MNRLNIFQKDLEVQQYAFIEASAGTGKTFAIEHLAVRMVLAGIPISRLLIMTFTKAAKAELVRRIHHRLLASLEACENGFSDIPYLALLLADDKLRQEAKRFLSAALQSFHEAKITTIHGICHSLLSKYAFEAGISLDFFEERGIKERLETFSNYIQGHLQKGDLSSGQLKIVLNACGGNLSKLMERVESSGGRPSKGVALAFSSICTYLDEVLCGIGPLDREKWIEDFQTLKRHYNGLNPCTGQAEVLNQWLSKGHASLNQIEEFLQEEAFFWDLICEKNQNKVVAKKKEPLVLHYPALIETLQEKISPLLEGARAPASILQTLAQGYKEFCTHYADYLQTPDDLLTTMQQAMTNPPFFTRVRGEFDAVVIDEFQDTDTIQWSIFEKLFVSERVLKALYLVGDPKQSIYAFRKADLYSYLRARDCFAAKERFHLAVNYRSEKALIGALNRLFSDPRISGWMPLPKRQSALEILPVDAAEHADENSLGLLEDSLVLRRRGAIHFLLCEATSTKNGGFPYEEIHKTIFLPLLAQEIAHLEKMNLFSLSHIALLVKDRSQAYWLVEGLKKIGISARFVRRESITASPLFPTLLALLRTLAFPQERVYLQRFLMSPVVNWTAETMHLTLAAAHEGRMAELREKLVELRVAYQIKGIGACLQEGLKLSTGTNQTLFEQLFSQKEEGLYEDYLHIQELLIEETSRGERTLFQLIAFLEEVQKRDVEEHKQLQRGAKEGEHTVTIMTLHGSKGLEFDVVFAIGAALRSPAGDSYDLEERDAEKMRLLYVGMTRAKRRLYLPVIMDQKKSPFKEGQAAPIELFLSRWIAPETTYPEWLESGSRLTIENLQAHLETLAEKDSFTWEVLTEQPALWMQNLEEEEVVLPEPLQLIPFWPREEIASFSSLLQKESSHSFTSPLSIPEDHLPLGAETGHLVHKIMEELFCNGWHHPLAEDKIAGLVQQTLALTPWKNCFDHLWGMIKAALTLPITPLQEGYASFTLCDVPIATLLPEMEFCYGSSGGLRKGFIDLFFAYQGLYYLVDWKTNGLTTYAAEHRDMAMQEHGYHLQATLYIEAISRYVKLFDKRPFSQCFGGAHYLFMRGPAWESFMQDVKCPYVS